MVDINLKLSFRLACFCGSVCIRKVTIYFPIYQIQP